MTEEYDEYVLDDPTEPGFRVLIRDGVATTLERIGEIWFCIGKYPARAT